MGQFDEHNDEQVQEDDYPGHDPESFNQWFPLEHEHLVGSPFKFYFAKLKSSSREAEELFMDPGNALRGTLASLSALEGVTEESRITTTIVGHERTLRARLIYAMAAVDAQDNSVVIVSNKEKKSG